MSCGVACRCGLDPKLLWLWCRPEATALIQPLAWEPPYAMDAALKRQKEKKKKEIEDLVEKYTLYDCECVQCIHACSTHVHACVCVCVCLLTHM